MISKLFYCSLKGTSRVVNFVKLQIKINSLSYKLCIQKSTKQAAQIGARGANRRAVSISDNVFTDCEKVILLGITIGNSTSIAAGNSAKLIKPIDDYIKAHREVFKKELGSF